MISKEGVSMDPTKVEVVLQWEPPKTVSKVVPIYSENPLFSVLLEFLSSILVETVEKCVPLNLIKSILKFGVIWITCSRSLEFGLVLLSGLEDFL